ncbi:MAG TPA: threonylcarbamoyl-AMP synthase [Deltaproteobacteria bacterium]|nr:translation factor Sua5 [Deltaproteobacteria bacterium]HCP48130.1 threonylcarbamoyl-AMP synthase [Deltaproteobacteria bacterium]
MGVDSVIRWVEGGSLELARTVELLLGGGLLVYPTETVYGIGTALSAGDPGVERVRRAKGSAPGRPYLVLAGDRDAAFSLWTRVSPAARAMALEAWPGPLTLVGPARDGLPQSLLGHVELEGTLTGRVPTISVRVPGDPRLVELLQALGQPLVSTSANPAGAPPPDRFDGVDLDSLAPDLAIDGGVCRAGTPSTIISVVGDRPRLLRAGAWPFEEGQA